MKKKFNYRCKSCPHNCTIGMDYDIDGIVSIVCFKNAFILDAKFEKAECPECNASLNEDGKCSANCGKVGV